jgi:hypothetical protein
MNRKTILWALSALPVVLVVPALALACSVCLGGADGNDPLTDAFNSSVLFLMAMPYAIVGSIGGWIFYRHRSVRKRGTPEKTTSVLHLAWNDKESRR